MEYLFAMADTWRVISDHFDHRLEQRGRERRLVDRDGTIIVQWTEKKNTNK